MTIRDLRTHEIPFVTVAELAAYVRLTTRTLYKEIAAGELRVKRVGPRGNIRIPIEEAQRYAGEGTTRSREGDGRAPAPQDHR